MDSLPCMFCIAAVISVLQVSTENTTENVERVTYEDAKAICRRQNMSLPLEIGDFPETKGGTFWLYLEQKQLHDWQTGNVTDIFNLSHNVSIREKNCKVKYSTGIREVDCFKKDFGAICLTGCTPCYMWDCHRINGTTCFRFRCGLHNWFQAREVCWALGGVLLDGSAFSLVREHWLCKEYWLANHKLEWVTGEWPNYKIPTETNWHPSTIFENQKNCAVVNAAERMFWRLANCTDFQRVVCINKSSHVPLGEIRDVSSKVEFRLNIIGTTSMINDKNLSRPTRSQVFQHELSWFLLACAVVSGFGALSSAVIAVLRYKALSRSAVNNTSSDQEVQVRYFQEEGLYSEMSSI